MITRPCIESDKIDAWNFSTITLSLRICFRFKGHLLVWHKISPGFIYPSVWGDCVKVAAMMSANVFWGGHKVKQIICILPKLKLQDIAKIYTLKQLQRIMPTAQCGKQSQFCKYMYMYSGEDSF